MSSVNSRPGSSGARGGTKIFGSPTCAVERAAPRVVWLPWASELEASGRGLWGSRGLRKIGCRDCPLRRQRYALPQVVFLAIAAAGGSPGRGDGLRLGRWHRDGGDGDLGGRGDGDRAFDSLHRLGDGRCNGGLGRCRVLEGGPRAGAKAGQGLDFGGRRAPPCSSTGTRQRKASSAPVTGDTGAQRSDTTPSAVQAGSRGALTARASHSRTRPAWPCCSPSMRAMRVAMRCVRRSSQQRFQSFACLVPFARLDRRDRQRNRPLAVVRGEAGQMAHAVEPIPRAVAGAGVGIGRGEVGMRREPPGPEQHARSPRRVAL